MRRARWASASSRATSTASTKQAVSPSLLWSAAGYPQSLMDVYHRTSHLSSSYSSSSSPLVVPLPICHPIRLGSLYSFSPLSLFSPVVLSVCLGCGSWVVHQRLLLIACSRAARYVVLSRPIRDAMLIRCPVAHPKAAVYHMYWLASRWSSSAVMRHPPGLTSPSSRLVCRIAKMCISGRMYFISAFICRYAMDCFSAIARMVRATKWT